MFIDCTVDTIWETTYKKEKTLLCAGSACQQQGNELRNSSVHSFQNFVQ